MKSQVRKHGESYVSGKYKYTHLGVDSESEGVPPVPTTSLQFSYFSYDYYDVIHLLQIPIIIINNHVRIFIPAPVLYTLNVIE